MTPRICFTTRLALGQAGGVESAVAEIVPRVRALRGGWDVRAVHAFRSPGRINRIPLFGDLYAALRLALRARGSDVVVVNGAEYAWPFVLSARGRRRTLVVWHGTRGAEIAALAPRMSLALWAYRVAEVWLQRAALVARTQVAVSDSTADEVRTLYGSRHAIDIVTNGAPAVESDRSHDPEANPLCIAWIGTNAYKKGLDLAVAAVEHARRHASGLRLVVIGIDDRKRPVPPWLRYLGRVSPSDARRWLSSSAALLATSRYEGCSVAVLEALSLGVPVVAGPNLGWMIGSGGIATGAYSVDAFARALVSLVTETGALRSMSGEARQRAKHFDWNLAAAAYVRLIEQRCAAD